jgi:uncharacterized protein
VSGRKIAVIGGGISGLTAAYILARTDEVTVFETGDRLGGHADTHLVPEPGEAPVPADAGGGPLLAHYLVDQVSQFGRTRPVS